MDESEASLYRGALCRGWLLLDAWKSILAINNIQALTRDPPPELDVTPENFCIMRWQSLFQSYSLLASAILDFAVMRIAKLKYGYYRIIWDLTYDYTTTPAGRIMLLAAIDSFANTFIRWMVNLPIAFHVLTFSQIFDEMVWIAFQCVLSPTVMYLHVYFVEQYGVASITAGYLIGYVIWLAFYKFKIQVIDPLKKLPLHSYLNNKEKMEIAGPILTHLIEDSGYPEDRLFIDVFDPVAHIHYETAFYARSIVTTEAMVELMDHKQLLAMVAHELGHFKYCTPYITYVEQATELMAMGGCWYFAYGNRYLHSIFQLDSNVHPAVPVCCTMYYVSPLFTDLFKGVCNLIRSQFIYAADNYASTIWAGQPLGEALLKLLPTTTPTGHKTTIQYCQGELFSSWHTGHPPPVKRIPRLLNF